MSEFFQDPPRLENTYLGNRWMKSYLRYKLPKEIFSKVDKDLERFGAECAGPFLNLARQAEREKPHLVQYDPWGKRIDEIRVSPAWTELQDISAREGLIATAYKRAQGEFSRLYQFSKLFLFHPSSAFFTCPLAMADGAAKVMELYGMDDVHRQAFAHLTSTKPEDFWTSGQWMTERAGGSDVSFSETQVRFENNRARLYGTKWFSSATTSQMALALGRCPDAPEGSRGLTLFMVHTYLKPGELNHIKVLRLKDKLGTWALPTAELSLEGAWATQVGARDQGVKTVASMLNITRLYNSVCSVGQATRGLELLRDYSSRRKTFGQKLDDHVLHYSTFAKEEMKTLTGFLLTFELAHLLGKEECKTATHAESEVLRLMTPVCKLFTAKSAIQTSSEVIEGFGGAGYIEDTGIPVNLRDSQVFPIWEGATNVLSLDLLRVIQKGQGLHVLSEDITAKLSSIKKFETNAKFLAAKLADFEGQIQKWSALAQTPQMGSARSLAFHIAKLYAQALLLEWAEGESPENQKVLSAAITHQEKSIGSWYATSEEACSRAKSIWTGGLR